MKGYNYHLELSRAESPAAPGASVSLDFTNHDDIFRILDAVKGRGSFESEEEAVQFALGVKLLGGVLMNHRGEALFSDFEPAFGALMRKLKGAE